MKVPWVPCRSGTHMADSMVPANGSAGKVMGTRNIDDGTPWRPSTSQNGRLLRSRRTSALPSGMR